jgi:capsular polysaccharide transport system permease protein
MSPTRTDPSSTVFALRQKWNVMAAVVLRDMRTRFFNHGLGFLVQTLWPLAHIFMLIIIYNFAGRQAPYGESLNVFFASALLPTMSFMYVSRFMSLSLIINRPMLSFPAVTVLDIMFGRAFLEVIAAGLTLALTITILWAIGDNPFPFDPLQAILAYVSVLILAVGVGILAGVVVMFFQMFATIYALAMVLVYVSSGVLFVSSMLPDAASYALSWNPVFQGVEWMRTAFYEGYNNRYLDKTYLIAFGFTSLALGLALERVFRRTMLEG